MTSMRTRAIRARTWRLVAFCSLTALLASCASNANSQSPDPSGSAGPAVSATETVASSSSPSGSGSAEASLPAGGAWREVGSFGAPDTIERVTAMVFAGGQFVAVGNHYATAYAPDDELPPPEGRVWVSPDGRTWESLTGQATFKNASLDNLVAATDGTLLAFGSAVSAAGAGSPAVWRSVDGRTWDRSNVGLPSDLRVTRVVHGAQGYLLYGSYQQMWFSRDGLAWERVDEGRTFWGVGAGDEGFVALHEALSGDSAITTASANGRDWFMGDSLPGGAAVAPLGPDWISAVVPGVVEFPVDLQIWSSANGLDWTRVATIHDPQDRDSFGYVHGLVSAGGRVFLTVTLSVCCGVAVPAGVWWSENGTVWEQADTDPESLVTAAAEHDGTVILAGYVGVTEGRATFWVNEGR